MDTSKLLVSNVELLSIQLNEMCILITFSISNCDVLVIHFSNQTFVFAIVFSDTAVFVLAIK